MNARPKSASRRIARVLAAVALVLGGIEVGARVLHLAPPLETQYRNYVPDPYLPFKPRPLETLTGRSRSDEFDYSYTHNSVGFRDVEHALAKPPGVFRIVGVGDSFTYGAGAPFDDTYLARLEAQLNARSGTHPRVEIVKMGISRYFTEPERMVLEHYGLAYQPDLVVVGFMPNDVVDTHLGLGALSVDSSGYLVSKEAARLGTVGLSLYLHSHAARVVLSRYLESARRADVPPDFQFVYQESGPYEHDWEKVEAELGRIVQLARSVGARVAVVHIPQIGPWEARHEAPAARLARLGERDGFLLVDALPALREAASAQSLYWEKDGHARPAGYHVIADAIERALVDGVVP